MSRGIVISQCVTPEQAGWLSFRMALWPGEPKEKHLEEMRESLTRPDQYAQFIARYDDGEPIGFAECSIRSDYVNGTETTPVGFLEGIYVAPEHRRKGVAAALTAAVAEWARASGCRELASDASLDNEQSHAMHRALGFAETERVVY